MASTPGHRNHGATLPSNEPAWKTQKILFLEVLSISLPQNQPFPKESPSSRAHMETQLTANISLHRWLRKATRTEPGLSVNNAKNQTCLEEGEAVCCSPLCPEQGKWEVQLEFLAGKVSG